MRRLRPLRSLLAVSVAAAVLIPAQQAFAFTDVPSSYWDYTQITYATPWMSDYGSTSFYPTRNETRSYGCRTFVRKFDPNESLDTSITFPDLPKSDPMYPYANVCVKLGWFPPFKDGSWSGWHGIARINFDQALILAMNDLGTAVKGLKNLHEDNGSKPYVLDSRWPYMQLATYLRLHYDHSDDTTDLEATTYMRRDEVAYSLYAATHLASYSISNANSLFTTVSVPTLVTSDAGQNTKFQLTQYALSQVGFPYIWGGEWNTKSPSGYCCGYQTEGGFDCSGFAWWVLKKNEDGYDAAQFRSYPGWSLHERVASDMARATTNQLSLATVAVGNLMFFASDGGHTAADVDHVGVYVGNSWMVHSTAGGPQLETVKSGWYHDHFVWGRALSSNSLAPGAVNLGAGEGPLAGQA